MNGNNLIVLKSELDLARIYKNVGDISQSINVCKKNLPQFKKVFSEQSDDYFNTLQSKTDEKVDITSSRWSNLPSTARKLDKVSPLFESKDIFRRDQVTEKNLRKLNIDGELSNYKYLLFAMHGLFVPDMPEVSSMVLSQEFKNGCS